LRLSVTFSGLAAELHCLGLRHSNRSDRPSGCSTPSAADGFTRAAKCSGAGTSHLPVGSECLDRLYSESPPWGLDSGHLVCGGNHRAHDTGRTCRCRSRLNSGTKARRTGLLMSIRLMPRQVLWQKKKSLAFRSCTDLASPVCPRRNRPLLKP
jgi:hypothetical protein